MATLESILLDKQRLRFVLMAILPLIAPVLTSILVGISAGPPSGAEPATEAGGGPSATMLIFLFSLFVAKVLAVAGLFFRWYYAWVYHLLELNFFFFFHGLVLVSAIFNAELNIVGFVAVLVGAFLFFVLFHLRGVWLMRDTKDLFDVNRIAQP